MITSGLEDLKKHHRFTHDWLFDNAESLGFGEIHLKIDHETGLRAIVAIHSNKLGPALGGCRCIMYDSVDDALEDSIRLAQMMSYKAAVCGLPHGGGKSVLIRPPEIKDHEAYFRSFAKFIDQLNGRYIAAIDSGTESRDMDVIAKYTPYVTCGSNSGGDPAPHTARGVVRGIQAAVAFKLGKDNLNGIHVAIQGAGHVGYLLAKYLVELGAQITQTDTHADRLQRCVDDFNVMPVSPSEIYNVDCDVFAPCALGGTVNTETISNLKASIVAGSANNQLAHKRHGIIMHEYDILYAPDFVINSGGLIFASAIYDHGDIQKAEQQIEGLYETLWSIFERSKAENHATSEIAESIALEKLA